MINMQEVLETNNMIAHEKLDVRTITMGISLLDCVDSDLAASNFAMTSSCKRLRCPFSSEKISL